MTDVKINLSQPILNNLLHHSGASALIVLSGGEVVGNAGTVSDSAVHTLVSAFQRHWPASIDRDLIRYVGLSIDNDDRLLSAKFFPERDVLLGLVFPLQISLCQIRQDLTNLMQNMLSQKQDKYEDRDELEQSLQILFKDYPEPDPGQLSGPTPSAEHMKDKKMTEEINGSAFPDDQAVHADTQPTIIENEPRPSTYGEPVITDEPKNGEEETEELDLAMEDIPWQPLEDLMQPEEETTAGQSQGVDIEEEQKNEVQRSAWQPLEDHAQQEDDLASILQEDFESVQDLTPADDIVLPVEDLPDPVEVDLAESEDEREVITGEAEPVEWQPVAADITFYLVPRLKRHFLVKELPHELRRWIPEICEIYGWQLDALSVRPDYLKWTLRDFPESLVRKMLRIIRRETSQRIFEDFPNLKHGNPTEDFWSQSYLVDRENLEISTQALIAHVAKERLTGRKAS